MTMIKLFNPKDPDFSELDEKSTEIMLKTIKFFEDKGMEKIIEDDHACVWYDDFIEFQKKEKILLIHHFRPCLHLSL